MSKVIEYTIVYPNGKEVKIHSIKASRNDIGDYLMQNPLEVVRVYRGKKLYCKYGLIDGDIAQARFGAGVLPLC